MRTLIAILSLVLACAPYRQVPYLTVRQAADQCPAMLGVEVIVFVPETCYAAGSTGLEVFSGRPNAPPLLTFRGVEPPARGGSLHISGRVFRVVPCEPGIGYKHRIEFEACRIMSRIN